jgi:hypothetical protein
VTHEIDGYRFDSIAGSSGRARVALLHMEQRGYEQDLSFLQGLNPHLTDI